MNPTAVGEAFTLTHTVAWETACASVCTGTVTGPELHPGA
jgi:hypothetical protein